MLIDERIQELTEEGAKKFLRRAVEQIADRMVCGTCAMQIVCGEEATADDCMCRALTLMAIPGTPTEAAGRQDDDGTVYYDPETMRIVE